MNRLVINIDFIGGIGGINKLLEKNPDWDVKFGATHSIDINGEQRTINFAVFELDKNNTCKHCKRRALSKGEFQHDHA